MPAVAQVYVWGRRHPYVHLNFLGLFNFTAPYLPWVLLAFSVTLRSNAVVDLLGIVAGLATMSYRPHLILPRSILPEGTSKKGREASGMPTT